MGHLSDFLAKIIIEYKIDICLWVLIISIAINIKYLPLVKDKKVFKNLPTWRKHLVVQSYSLTAFFLLFWIFGICSKLKDVLFK